nr:hypothetical protein [Microvirga arsenatis]
MRRVEGDLDAVRAGFEASVRDHVEAVAAIDDIIAEPAPELVVVGVACYAIVEGCRINTADAVQGVSFDRTTLLDGHLACTVFVVAIVEIHDDPDIAMRIVDIIDCREVDEVAVTVDRVVARAANEAVVAIASVQNGASAEKQGEHIVRRRRIGEPSLLEVG